MAGGAETSATLLFGPGRYRFFLPLKAIVELERLCADKPIGVIYDEISGSIGLSNETQDPVYLIGGTARAKDAYQVIRLAAQYGAEAEVAGEVKAVSALDATRLVEDYVDSRPYDEFMPVAWAILRNTLSGVTLKKKAAAPESPSPLAADTSSLPAGNSA